MHACPACRVHPSNRSRSSSSSVTSTSSTKMHADLPPHSSRMRFIVDAEAAITSRPTAELPVKRHHVHPGIGVRTMLASTPLGVTTLTTPGRDVGLLVDDRASASPANGVSGDGLSTIVLPAASAARELHHVQRVREVPRGHRCHHTERLIPQQRRARGPPKIRRRLDRLHRQFRGASDHEGGTVDLDESFVCCTAPFGLRERVDLVASGEQGVAELLEASGSFLGCSARTIPRNRKPTARQRWRFDLARRRHPVQSRSPARWRDRRRRIARCPVDPSTVDVVPIGVDKGTWLGHRIRLPSWSTAGVRRCGIPTLDHPTSSSKMYTRGGQRRQRYSASTFIDSIDRTRLGSGRHILPDIYI